MKIMHLRFAFVWKFGLDNGNQLEITSNFTEEN